MKDLLDIKCLRLTVSEKKILCRISYEKVTRPRGGGHLWQGGHNLKILVREPLGDVTC